MKTLSASLSAEASRYPSIRNKSLITKREKLLNDRRQMSVLGERFSVHSLFALLIHDYAKPFALTRCYCSAHPVIVFVMLTWVWQHNVMDLDHDTQCNTFTPIGVSVTLGNSNCFAYPDVMRNTISWETSNWPHATSWMTPPRLCLLLTTHFLLTWPRPALTTINCKKQLGQWALTAALCTRGSSCLWWSHLMSGLHTQSLDPLLVMSLSLSKYENRLPVTHVTLVEQIPSSALGLVLSQSRYDL